MSQYINIKVNSVQNYTARTEFMQGRQFLVVPVVMLVEGVHSGSAGPVFYPAEELRDLPAAWNGRPVTLGHPPAGAGSPEALEEFMLGTVFNAAFDEEHRLVGEAWLDVALTRQRAPELLDAVQNGKAIEVSTGLWFEEHGGPGVWNDEAFMTTATAFRPDHLALLPNAVGACSIEDGCGIRNEQEDQTTDVNDNKKQEVSFMEGFKRMLRNFIDNETKPERVKAMLKDLAENKPGMVSTARALQQHVDSLDRDTPNGSLVHWLEEAFEDGTFIMRQRGSDGQKFFRGTFTVDAESGDVEVGDDFTEVMEQREFVETNEQENTIEEVVDVDPKEKIVAELIACDKTHFNESHKEALMAMDEVTLTSLKAKDVEPDNTAPGDDAAAAAADAEINTEEVPAEDQTMAQYLEDVPEHLKEEAAALVKANEDKRIELTATILGSEGCKFTDAHLQAKPIEELELIASLVGNEAEVEDKPVLTVDNIGAPMGRIVSFAGKPGTLLTNEDDDIGAPMGRPMALTG